MSVTESALPHVGKLDGPLRARVHKPIAAQRVELSSSDNLSQLLHVGWLDVDNVEALILNVEVPQVDAEVIAADEGLAIAIDGYAVDVIGMSICIGSTGHCSNNSVVVGKTRHDEIFRILEAMGWGLSWCTAATGDIRGR